MLVINASTDGWDISVCLSPGVVFHYLKIWVQIHGLNITLVKKLQTIKSFSVVFFSCCCTCIKLNIHWREIWIWVDTLITGLWWWALSVYYIYPNDYVIILYEQPQSKGLLEAFIPEKTQEGLFLRSKIIAPSQGRVEMMISFKVALTAGPFVILDSPTCSLSQGASSYNLSVTEKSLAPGPYL